MKLSETDKIAQQVEQRLLKYSEIQLLHYYRRRQDPV